MPLNIDFQQILLHLFNFAILFAILYFLLYKPVKQFMDRRTDYYKKLDDQARANLAESENTKAAYAQKLSAVEEEIAESKAVARKEQESAKAAKIKQAEEEAAKIVADARILAEKERAKLLKEAQGEITKLVTDAAEKIISGGSTSDAFDQFLVASATQRGESDD